MGVRRITRTRAFLFTTDVPVCPAAAPGERPHSLGGVRRRRRRRRLGRGALGRVPRGRGLPEPENAGAEPRAARGERGQARLGASDLSCIPVPPFTGSGAGSFAQPGSPSAACPGPASARSGPPSGRPPSGRAGAAGGRAWRPAWARAWRPAWARARLGRGRRPAWARAWRPPAPAPARGAGAARLAGSARGVLHLRQIHGRVLPRDRLGRRGRPRRCRLGRRLGLRGRGLRRRFLARGLLRGEELGNLRALQARGERERRRGRGEVRGGDERGGEQRDRGDGGALLGSGLRGVIACRARFDGAARRAVRLRARVMGGPSGERRSRVGERTRR